MQGWQAIRGMLLATIPNKNGGPEKPGLFVTSNCVHWLQTVPVLRATSMAIPRTSRIASRTTSPMRQDICSEETQNRRSRRAG